MLNNLFQGLFDSSAASVITVTDFLLCVGCSLLTGLLLACGYMYKTRYTKSFVITLALLPAVVCVVIMMVNGNIGTGVAVAGAFSLVRFRSVPGTAKEIGILFLAMGAGLIAGMGYLGYSVLFAVILSAASMIYSLINFGEKKNSSLYKTIRITIPEDLDYNDVIEPLLAEYTSNCDLIQVKTTNMGSLFRLTYNVTFKNENTEKDLINKLRCRNGNLEITVSRQDNSIAEL
ncbi:MAG: DUF4956 domain-containing protein [Clostridia bacterium]|nr:DUF4956 domain-containing protein [Clostridia bacterium]